MEVIVKKAKFIVKDANEHIQGHWMKGNFYEASGIGLLSYLHRNGYNNMRCLDIGASIGNHTIYFSMMLDCDVIAFEPFKDSFKHLEENCRLNGIDAKLYRIALGNKMKRVTMKPVYVAKYNVGMMQVAAGNDTEMDTLDNIVSGQFGFIKIDVEHFNVPLLKGSEKTLKNQERCHVFIECETDQMLRETDTIMNSYGYTRDINVILNHTPTYLWKK